MSVNVAADQLCLFIERIERLEEEKRGQADDIKEVYAEAKSNGYDVPTIRQIVRLRGMEKHHRDEAEALLDTYKAALGMGDGSFSEAMRDFEDATKDTAVSMSGGGGEFVPINQRARDEAAAKVD